MLFSQSLQPRLRFPPLCFFAVVFFLFTLKTVFYLYHSPPPFFLSQPSHIPITFLQIHGFFSSTVMVYILGICMNIYILKYNWLHLSNVTCMYVFRDDSLALGNHWGCSSLGMTRTATPSFARLSEALCAGLRTFSNPIQHPCSYSARVWEFSFWCC